MAATAHARGYRDAHQTAGPITALSAITAARLQAIDDGRGVDNDAVDVAVAAGHIGFQSQIADPRGLSDTTGRLALGQAGRSSSTVDSTGWCMPPSSSAHSP